MLVGAGANAGAIATTGATALHFAAGAGTVEGVEALVAAGADIDGLAGASAQTPLMFAAAAGRLDAVRKLIELGANYEIATTVVDYRERGQADGQERRRRQEFMTALRKAQGEDEAEEPRTDGPATQSQNRDPNRTFAEDRRGPRRGPGGHGCPGSPGPAGRGDEEDEDEADSREEPAEDEPDDEPDEESDEEARSAGRGALQRDSARIHRPRGQAGRPSRPCTTPVREGHRDVVATLLDAGTDVNVRTGGDQSTPPRRRGGERSL